ncbi:uncharacterized protein LOC122964660 [Acropora millepora]|uniref:uncharacterized protein LOC122964660 n=1 Tax=Acropora millepora TaxID=45264 RepID=UPI001CF58E24|nr:uncharacterized protein LOC122964660 [Acropora millepora]
MTTPQPQTIYQNQTEKGTESVKWVDSSLIEKTNELNQAVEKVKRDIIKEEERINHQHDQLKVLLDTAHDALEVPTVNPIALEQGHEDATLRYSTLQNTATQKDAAEPRKAQNPYTLKAAAWKGKSGVLNARPLPTNTGVAQVAVPVEVKQFMFNPTETMTTPQPQTIYQNQTEKGTESVKWVDSSLIEKTNELNQAVEKVKRDIIKEEERINHQHDQLKVLLDTAHDALEVPTVNPIALEQGHEDATLRYSTLQNTATQKDAAEPRKAQNPYTLKAAAWKGKSGVLNARPLPTNTGVAQVAVPVEVKQFMFNPTETMTTPQPQTIYQNQTEKGTESVKWVDSSLIEKTNELNQAVEKVKRDIIKEEERINHQHDQLKVLLDTAHDALEVPTVNPIALEQGHEDATLRYSTLQNTATQKDAAEPRKAQNPYTLKAAAWKGKSGVLNARPLPTNTGVAQVAVPVEVKQFMFNPTETMTTPQPQTIYQNQTGAIFWLCAVKWRITNFHRTKIG